MNESEKDILRKSLLLIAGFSKDINSVGTPSEFLKIHTRNLSMLTEIAKKRDSDFMRDRIREYPKINESEIEYYITSEKKEKSLLNTMVGPIFDGIYNLIKNKGVSLNAIENKLNKINSLNEKMEKVVQDPIYEDLYLKTME